MAIGAAVEPVPPRIFIGWARHCASLLSDMANKDHLALSHMLDSASFSDEVSGFHAQQTIEKALKAWIAVRGLVYPKSHDVSFG
jgi:HEPN domain-containing protein